MAWTRALNLEPQHISEEIVLNQHEMNAKAKMMEKVMKLIGMKFRIGERNTDVNDQQATDADTKNIESIIKLINMKFRTGKRDIRDSDQQNTNCKEDENIGTLTKLRDNMEKRSFSSFAHQDKNRENGWYLKILLSLCFTLCLQTKEQLWRHIE